nr:MerR family transcriptional regulator [Cupriavidus sp. AU9028]
MKVGELARRCGLTVRTLHHYDAIGLLAPSARAENGYRLYGREDIARLHQIQALRRFGLSLAEIGAYLDQPDTALADLVSRQIDMLDRQIEQAGQLRQRLAQLREQLLDGAEPELADWLTTLELMTVYDKYFSQDELDRMPLYRNRQANDPEWPALVAEVQAQLDAGVPAEDERPRQLALRWMEMLVRDTGGDPRLLVKLNSMHEQEPALQEQMGVSPRLLDYVLRAFSERQMRIYERYLSPQEAAYMRANYGKRAGEWPQLMADVRQALETGTAPDSRAGIELARRWLDLFRSYAGDNPATHAKFRQAMMSEPDLAAGSWASGELLDFMRQAMGALSGMAGLRR